MATFQVRIDMSNAAFGDDDLTQRNAEVSRILGRLSLDVGEYTREDYWELWDINGNRVGEAIVRQE